MPLERRYASWKTLQKRPVPAVIVGALISIPILGLSLLSRYLRHLAPPGLFDVFDLLGGFISHFLLVGAFFTANWLTGAVALRRVRRLFDNPSDQFAVSVEFKREVRYGCDEGLISFVDGWLLFNGRACSFSVRQEDVQRLIATKKHSSIGFAGPAGVHEVTFTCQDQERLGEALAQWRKEPNQEGESIFPPVLPDPTAVWIPRFWFSAAVLAAAAGLTIAFFERSWGLPILMECGALILLNLGIQVRLSLSDIAKLEPFQRRRLASLTGIDNYMEMFSSDSVYQFEGRLEKKVEDSETLSVR